MDQPPEAEIAHHRPADFEDLLLRVVQQQFIEQVLVDVGVVDEEALGVVQRGLLGVAEVAFAPIADLRDSRLFEPVPCRRQGYARGLSEVA